MKLSRRSFLKNTTAASAGAALSGGLVQSVLGNTASVLAAGPGNKWPGRVVINFNKTAVTSSGANASVIQKMVDDSILLLTGQTTLAAAWQSIFPSSLSATSKIAIKIPIGYNDGLPAPHWASVKGITDGLQQMTINGTRFPAANITIYDMAGAGTFANSGYTAANFPGITILKDNAINGGDGALSNRTYAATLKNATFLISVFSPRGHSLPPKGSGFTLGFKNHFGTYSNPSGMHSDVPSNEREITCTGPVINKLVLSMCSGIYGMNEGVGPGGSAAVYTTYAQSIDKTSTNQCPTTIILSTDPVSAEMQAIKMIRINGNGKYATADMPPYLQASAGITASPFTSAYNVGTINESAMDIRRIVNGSAVTSIRENALSQTGMYTGSGITAAQTGGHSTFIEFALPESNLSENASIEITNMKGALVWKSSRKVMGTVNHFAWDHRDAAGNFVRPGIFIVRVVSGAETLAAKFSIVR